MIDKLIEGKLLTLIVGSAFRLVEILVRAVHLAVRGVRLLVQEAITSRLDRRISALGKRLVARRASVDAASIVIVERDGEYTGDCKYIAEEILRRGMGARITWTLREKSVGPFPREFRFVRYGTAAFFRAVAGAGVVFHDGRALADSGAVQGRGQHWVGLGGALTSGKVETHARNDILLDPTPETIASVRKKVLDRLGITDRGQRFLLYAPTHGSTRGTGGLSGIDFRTVRSALSARFGGSWELLIRTHARSAAESDLLLAGLPAYCRDASGYPDTQELLVVADAGVSDGADWIFDYLLTRKPAFFFTTRGGGPVSGLDVAPLTVLASQRQLLSAIEGFDREAHVRSVEELLARRGSADDGHAAERIVDQIEEWVSR